MGIAEVFFSGRSLFPGCSSGANDACDVCGTAMAFRRIAAWGCFVFLCFVKNVVVFMPKTNSSAKPGAPAEELPELSSCPERLIEKYSAVMKIKIDSAKAEELPDMLFSKKEKSRLPAFFEKVFYCCREFENALSALVSGRRHRPAAVWNKKFNEKITQQYKIIEGAFKWEAQG